MQQITRITEYTSRHEVMVETESETYLISLSDYKSMLLLEHDYIDDDTQDSLLLFSLKLACVKKAMQCLSYGDLSEKRLCEKLKPAFDEAAVEAAVSLLKKNGYVDDARNSARVAEILAYGKKYGVLRIRNELYKKGYTAQSINTALEGLDPERLEQNAVDLLYKRFPGYRDYDRNEKAKLYAAMQRLGYSFGEVRQAIKNTEQDV